MDKIDVDSGTVAGASDKKRMLTNQRESVCVAKAWLGPNAAFGFALAFGGSIEVVISEQAQRRHGYCKVWFNLRRLGQFPMRRRILSSTGEE